ncbi:MAG: AAA family ATPase [Candidatus Melainabacteria bacterium]|nr:AAA family ATPase [Candidatus Melainabacteria bacterium]
MEPVQNDDGKDALIEHLKGFTDRLEKKLEKELEEKKAAEAKARRRKVVKRTSLAALAASGVAWLYTSSGPEEFEAIAANKPGIEDRVPDTVANLFVSDLDQIINKIKLGKVESVSIKLSSSMGTLHPTYDLKLTNGNLIHFKVPSDDDSNKRFISALNTMGSERIDVEFVDADQENLVQDLSAYALKAVITLMIFLLAIRGSIGISKAALKQLSDKLDERGESNPFSQLFGKEFEQGFSEVGFEDVRGNKENVSLMEDLVALIRQAYVFKRKAEKSDGDDTVELVAKVPKGVLLHGSPGTGKTLMAKAIAGELGANFFSVNGSEVGGILMGLGSLQLSKLFKQAKEAAKTGPVVIFIDELDTLGKKRTLFGNSDNKTVSRLLTEMDGFEELENILVIAASNRPDDLDEALRRPGRFDYELHVRNPVTATQRADILEKYITEKRELKQIDEEITPEQLAARTSGFSPAELVSVINKAGIQAIRDGRNKIEQVDIDEALKQVKVGVKSSFEIDDKDLQGSAIHELGHLLINHIFDRESDGISIDPRGASLAHVTHVVDDSRLITHSKSDLLKDLLVVLGGRAADTVHNKDENTGTSSDFSKARKIIRAMLTANMLGKSTMTDYSDDKTELTDEDRTVAEHLFEQAQKTANTIMEKLGPETVAKMVGILFERVEIAGVPEVQEFIKANIEREFKDEAIAASKAFLENPTAGLETPETVTS